MYKKNSLICEFKGKAVLLQLKIVAITKMNKRDKLLQRFCNNPKDFTFEEMESLFHSFGFETFNKGATSGSRIEFYNKEKEISYIMHKPHPSNIIKGYVMKQVMMFLKANKLI